MPHGPKSLWKGILWFGAYWFCTANGAFKLKNDIQLTYVNVISKLDLAYWILGLKQTTRICFKIVVYKIDKNMDHFFLGKWGGRMNFC